MSIRKIMDKTEKLCIIIIPIVYILADVLSGFVPSLSNLTDEKGYLIVLSTLMVLSFVHLDRVNDDKAKIIRSKKIIKDMVTLLEKKKTYKEIHILAVTGYQYYRAFEESGIKAKKVRLLLRKTDNINTISLPPEENDKTKFIDNANGLVRDWKRLEQIGVIDELEVLYYDFDTLLHFMILDDKQLFFGLLYPLKEFPGTNVLSSYIVGNKFELGENMISDFKEKWDMIAHFSQDLN